MVMRNKWIPRSMDPSESMWLKSIKSQCLSLLDISVNEPMITDGLKWPGGGGGRGGGRGGGGGGEPVATDALPAQDRRKRSHLSLTWLLLPLLSVEGYLTAPEEEAGGGGGGGPGGNATATTAWAAQLNAKRVKVNGPRPSLLRCHQVDRLTAFYGLASFCGRRLSSSHTSPMATTTYLLLITLDYW